MLLFLYIYKIPPVFRPGEPSSPHPSYLLGGPGLTMPTMSGSGFHLPGLQLFPFEKKDLAPGPYLFQHSLTSVHGSQS